MRELTAMPRWFWLLPMAAMALWWPMGAYWASDDFIAVAYSQHFGDAASDLLGRQYGATDVWAFYRPLITLSFWFDQTVAGPWPPFGHCSNVVAHGISTLLVALIWRRFLGNGAAFGAGFLWAMMAAHVGSIAWVVGRVDSHTTVWCLCALWLCLRANEQRALGQRGARWPAVVATALALMSKELAFVVPPLCTWLTLCTWRALHTDSSEARPTLPAQLRGACHATWPIWLLFALYLPFRVIVLGKFGGYDAASFGPNYSLAELGQDLLAKLSGMAHIVLDLLLPLRWIGGPPAPSMNASAVIPHWPFLLAAGCPIAIALLLALVRRPRLVLGTMVAFAVAMAPMVAFWTEHSPHNLRYYYLPAVALVGLLASAGRWLVLAVALAWLWPLLAVRSEQHHADRTCQEMHAELLKAAPMAKPGPMFVAGMPHTNASGTAVQLHFGVDRMLQPPFLAPGRQLFALRPLATEPGIFRLTQRSQPPFALPEGSTFWFRDPQHLQAAPPSVLLPELPIAGDSDGVLDMSTDRLMPLIAQYEDIQRRDGDTFGLTMPAVKGPFWRMTLFTANGYLCCIFMDHSKPSDTDGRIDVLRLLAKSQKPAYQYQVARLMVGDVLLGEALQVPTTIDLVPEFPTLIEAGTFDMATQQFTPSHRAARLVRLRFDRRYPEWVRTAKGG